MTLQNIPGALLKSVSAFVTNLPHYILYTHYAKKKGREKERKKETNAQYAANNDYHYIFT